MPTRIRQWLTVAGIVFLVCMIHIASLRKGHAWGGDFAQYVGGAKNLALGTPYAQTGYYYNPNFPSIGPPTYPPGTSLLLAPVYRMAGLDLEVMKRVLIVGFLIFLITLAGCFAERLPFLGAIALVLIVGLNPFFIENSNLIGSDGPFLALLYLSLMVAGWAEAKSDGSRGRFGWYAVTGLLVYAAFATRTLGLLVIPALWGQDLIRRRKITLPVVLATTLFGLLALLQSIFLHSDRHYLDQFGAGIKVLLHNAFGYGTQLAVFWHNGHIEPISIVLACAIGLLAVLGFARCVKQKVTHLEVFTFGYVLVILIWPSYQGQRYLFPVIPLYVYYFLEGLRFSWLLRRPMFQKIVVITLASAITISYTTRLATLDFTDMKEGIRKKETAEMFQAVRNATDKDDMVIFNKPRVMALFAERRSSAFHMPERDERLWDYFAQIDASLVVVCENDDAFGDFKEPTRLEYIRQFVARHPTRFEPMHVNEDFTIYRIQTPHK